MNLDTNMLTSRIIILTILILDLLKNVQCKSSELLYLLNRIARELFSKSVHNNVVCGCCLGS